MKDKLVKNGKRKGYYRFVAAVKGFGVAVLALVVLAAPVLIALDVAANETAAEQTSHQLSTEPPAESSLA